eukprot:TRINITY_DN55286_c0_g1_i1.p1 TRINITY_DN55286_c0_g1~~TRINITY_DN55286_c0_g1_i1.p1  ORF type:complete len:629 (+),score=205.52 TRINITY_DN55286_c0_g1_i1:87-1889(+)
MPAPSSDRDRDRESRKRSAAGEEDPPRKRRSSAEGVGAPPLPDPAQPSGAATAAAQAKQRTKEVAAAAKRRKQIFAEYRQQLVEAVGGGGGWAAAQKVFDLALERVGPGSSLADAYPFLPYQLYAEYVELAPDGEIMPVFEWMERPEVARLFVAAKSRTHFLTEIFAVCKSLSDRSLLHPGACARAKQLLAHLCPLSFDVSVIKRAAPTPNSALDCLLPGEERQEDDPGAGLTQLYTNLNERYGVPVSEPDKLLPKLRGLMKLLSTSAAEGKMKEVMEVCAKLQEQVKAARKEAAKPIADAVAACPEGPEPMLLPRCPVGLLGGPVLLHHRESRFYLLAEMAQALGNATAAVLSQGDAASADIRKVCAQLCDVWQQLERESPGAGKAARRAFLQESVWAHWRRELKGTAKVFEGAAQAREYKEKKLKDKVPAGQPVPERSSSNDIKLPAPPRAEAAADSGAAAYPAGIGVLLRHKDRDRKPKGSSSRSGSAGAVWEDHLGWGAWWGRGAAPDQEWLGAESPEPAAAPDWLQGEAPPVTAALDPGSVVLWHKVRMLARSHLAEINTTDDVQKHTVKWAPLLDPAVVARVEPGAAEPQEAAA